MERNRRCRVILRALPLPLCAQNAAPASAQPIFPSAQGQKLHLAGIPNAGKVTDVLYRGAQPKEVGLSELKMLGITTIVDLRGEDREKVAWERKRTESLGMRFVHIPVSGWAPPTPQHVAQFLSLLPPQPTQNISLHP